MQIENFREVLTDQEPSMDVSRKLTQPRAEYMEYIGCEDIDFCQFYQLSADFFPFLISGMFVTDVIVGLLSVC